jgi:leucyl/phenylalanyl-tRNA--protein transferase
MPIYRLTKRLAFPPPELAEDGLLAVGGDLSVRRLLLAYQNGIFPWYDEDDPILWWSPDPRMVFFPEQWQPSRRLARTIRSGRYHVTVDTAFDAVIRACAETPRRHEEGTWILPQMIDAYIGLHNEGYAHSFECWEGDQLAGGLYGVSIGACFFGESMFHRRTDASKVAFAALVECCLAWNFALIDAQLPNPNLEQLGGVTLPRSEFLTLLRDAVEMPTRRGKWVLR